MTRVPVVLHHGLFGFARVGVGPVSISYFAKIDQAIMDRGHPLIITGVHPAASIGRRAIQLKEAILRETAKLPEDNRKVVIIAHSLGGLDARHMITHLGMDRHVSALLTISTPHRGSPYADWVLADASWRQKAMGLAGRLGLDLGAIADLTTTACARFNEKTPDHPEVKYFSVSATCPHDRMPPWALHSHGVIEKAEGDNDGLVSVRSATYANHLGTWDADHWQAINRRWVTLWLDPELDISPRYLKALDRILM